MDEIKVYCDGGCRGNGDKNNIGGWGVVLQCGTHYKELKGAVKDTTNNVMELTAAIQALSAIKVRNVPVILTTDSSYVARGLTQWIHSWKSKGWINSKKEPVANKELWLKLDSLTDEFSDIDIQWCKGHADNEGNMRADQLANEAMDEVEE